MWYGGGGNTDNMETVQRPRQQACFSQYVCLKKVTRLLLSLFAKLIMSSFFVLEYSERILGGGAPGLQQATNPVKHGCAVSCMARWLAGHSPWHYLGATNFFYTI